MDVEVYCAASAKVVLCNLQFTLPIRARGIALADIATAQEKREAVQILLAAPFTL